MSNAPGEDRISDALPANEVWPRPPSCPCCGGERFEWLGEGHEQIAYIPRGKERSFFSWASYVKPQLRVCIDCGFLAMFADRELCDKLDAEYGRN